MKPNRHHAKTLLVLSVALLLASCGFHLREGVNLPADLGPLRVVSTSPYSPLAEALSQSLARSGAIAAPEPVAVSASPDDGQSGITPPGSGIAPPASPVATLNLRKERWGTFPVSIDARGRAQELTLRYAVEFDLLRADGSVLVPRQVVELARNYVTVPTQGIGTDSEQEILSKEMRRDMVASIMRRIDAALQSGGAVVEPAPVSPDAAAPPPTP